jgi:hypothetical protein
MLLEHRGKNPRCFFISIKAKDKLITSRISCSLQDALLITIQHLKFPLLFVTFTVPKKLKTKKLNCRDK